MAARLIHQASHLHAGSPAPCSPTTNTCGGRPHPTPGRTCIFGHPFLSPDGDNLPPHPLSTSASTLLWSETPRQRGEALVSGRTTPTPERPYPDSPGRHAPKTRAQPRVYSTLSRQIEDTSTCPTVRPSPRSRNPVQGLFDVRLEPWEIYDPEEDSYRDQIREVRTSLAAEYQRVKQHVHAAGQRAKELDAVVREKSRPLRDPLALPDHSHAAAAAERGIEPVQETSIDCEDISVPTGEMFIPLRRFSND